MPPDAERIARNTTYLTTALVVQKVLSFFFFLLIARILGGTGTGDYVAAFAMSSIFGVFIDLGFGPVLVRELARAPEQGSRYLGSVIWLKLWLSAGAFGGLLLTVLGLDTLGAAHPPIAVVAVAGLVMVIDSFTFTGTSVFRGYQQLWYESVVVILNKAFVLAVGAAILVIAPSSLGVALAILAGALLSFIILTRFLYRDFKLSWRPTADHHARRELWRLAAPFAFAGIFSTIYAYSDSVLLSILQGSEAVGRYSVAAKTMNAFQFIPSAFVAAIFPAMSRFAVTSPEQLHRILEASLRYLLIISAPIALGLYLLADEFVLRLGPDYLAAAPAVRVLMPSLVFVFLAFPLGALLNATNRQHWQTTVIGAGMALNLVLNSWLIPRFSYLGASWSWFATNAAVLVAGFVLVRRVVVYRWRPLLVSVIRVGLAAGTMGLAVLVLARWPVILVVPMSAAAYLAALFVSRELTGRDVSFFTGLFLQSREAPVAFTPPAGD